MLQPLAFFDCGKADRAPIDSWRTHLAEGGLYDHIEVAPPNHRIPKAHSCFVWADCPSTLEARHAYKGLMAGLSTMNGLLKNGAPSVYVRCLCQKEYQINYQWTHQCPCGVRIYVDSAGGITMTQGGMLIAGTDRAVTKYHFIEPVDSPLAKLATCDTCFGTGYFKGYGAPCQKGCKPRA